MSTLQISLPDSLKEFVESQAARGGYASTGEYLEAVLRAVQKRQAWDNLESLILEGLESPTREMTAQDWLELHRKVDA
jgi:antitoxin ParD1/3/4